MSQDTARDRVDGRRARAASRRAGPVLLVVMVRPGIRQRRGLAYRLPDGDAGQTERVVSARVKRAYALRWSDHAPVSVEYR